MRRKLYLVKREVIATSMENALKARGRIYEVIMTKEKNWPVDNKKVGFDNRKSSSIIKTNSNSR